MTGVLIVALAVTLTIADGVISNLGRQRAERDADVRLLIHGLDAALSTLSRYGLLP